ncbi:MAG TPA: 50S ribosomal protein L9 [Actinomycetota bacterium]|jgi:large subunit ribosomal protein L9|nr:50S ribosomal protein L9 [Actinomycetota bacterium]
MKIILQKEVENLGEPGDIVEVADGYARNFLIPRGMAMQATKGALKHAERVRTLHERQVAKGLEEARSFAARLEKTPVQVASQAGEDGRLFGSVTPQQIVEALERSVGEKVDRHDIRLDEPIRSTGTHAVRVHLHPEVDAMLTVQVVSL